MTSLKRKQLNLNFESVKAIERIADDKVKKAVKATLRMSLAVSQNQKMFKNAKRKKHEKEKS